jgi:transposase
VRRRWVREQGLLDPARLVFIDETSTNTAMVQLRGPSPRGKRLISYAPHGHRKTITFVAALRQSGMTAPFVLDGAMNGPMFLAYVKQCLAPTLEPGEIVFMDNLPVHKVAGVQEAIEAAGAAPDLNPIEMAFSKFKALLRKAGERTIPGLLRRIGRIVKSFRSHRMQQIPEPRRLCSDMTGIRSNSSLCVADQNDGVTR